MSNDLLFFNGLNGATGTYDIPPMPSEQLAQIIRGDQIPTNINELKYRYLQRTQTHLGVIEGVDPTNLSEAGWGVIFPHDVDPAIPDALDELLQWRKEQAGSLFRIYAGIDGYRPGESKPQFLARHAIGPGPADPRKMPYYLLLVGSPTQIPYGFQYQLDVQYAVGRIHFTTIEEYANYARSVVATEQGSLPNAGHRVTFFSVANQDDQATNLANSELVMPLYDKLSARKSGWEFELIEPAQARKHTLLQRISGPNRPALLFTASHGIAFPLDHPRQRHHQGALVCQDWPGPIAWTQEIPDSFYVASDDLESTATAAGSITFSFACYGAGTPANDNFAHLVTGTPAPIAPDAFVAALPQKLLGLPNGGALAFIGHIERAWGYSFRWHGAGAQTAVFESTIERLLNGHPVGSAVEYFNERYAELASDLSIELEEMRFGKAADPYTLAGMWTANNDARGYAIIGDPAVRLPGT